MIKPLLNSHHSSLIAAIVLLGFVGQEGFAQEHIERDHTPCKYNCASPAYEYMQKNDNNCEPTQNGPYSHAVCMCLFTQSYQKCENEHCGASFDPDAYINVNCKEKFPR